MTVKARYTTQLQAGLGLVPETKKLLMIWEPGMGGQDLLRVALASGEFPSVTARRLRNIVMEGFRPRFLVEDAAPARLLRPLARSLARDDFRSVCFLYTCRANLILRDFVRQVYWPHYSAGRGDISREESLKFVSLAVSRGRTTTRWSETTITRVGAYLLGACADFGLLGPIKRGVRPINGIQISPTVASILAYDLHFRGLGDNAMLKSADWGLFGLDAGDALCELKRLSLRGSLIVQSAGRAAHVSWKFKSMKELAGGIARG